MRRKKIVRDTKETQIILALEVDAPVPMKSILDAVFSIT